MPCSSIRLTIRPAAFFDGGELQTLVDFANRHDLILITDEIYDRILYDGREHISPGSLDGLVERTVTIGGLGKSFAVTGWRLGYVIAREPLAAAIRSVHDYSTICAPTPLQAAAAVAFSQPSDYWSQMREEYGERREVMLEMLRNTGFSRHPARRPHTIRWPITLPLPRRKRVGTRTASLAG